MAEKPKTVIKKPALYKMVSFKGVDKSASKETQEITTGLKKNLNAANSLGGTLNSIALALEKQTVAMKEMVQFQISQKGIDERYRKLKDTNEKRDAARQKIEDKKEAQREKRDDAAEVKTTSGKIIAGFVGVAAKTFGGFFAMLGSIATWLFAGIVKFAIFDWIMKNPDKVKALAKGLYAIGKWAFGVTSFLLGTAGKGLIKFLENPLSLRGFFGVMQFALGLAPIFAAFTILRNPLAALKGIKAVVGMLFGMVKNLMKAGGLGGKLRKVASSVLRSRVGGAAVFGGAAYAAARLSGAEQGEAIGTGVGAGAGQAIGASLGAATGIPGAGALAGAAGAFVGGAVGGGIGKAMQPIIDPFMKFFGAVGEVFASVFAPIQQAAGDFFKALGGAFNKVLDFIEPAMPMIKKVGAFFGTVAFAPLIGLMKALTFILSFFAGGGKKDEKPKVEKPKPTPKKEFKPTKRVSGRFDMDTGQAYINDKEVSTDEYMAYYNMSYAEKLKNYGVTIEKAAGGMVVVPKMDEGGEASEGESKLGAMFEFANDYRQMMTRKVMALSQLLALPIKAVGISIVSVIAKVGSMFAKFLPGPLKSMIGNFIAPLAEVFGVPISVMGAESSGGSGGVDEDKSQIQEEGNQIKALNKMIGGGEKSVIGLMNKIIHAVSPKSSEGGWWNPGNWFAGGGVIQPQVPEYARGGWINGPQSGYPVSLDGGNSVSFIGHGLEWVGMPNRASGGSAFIVPFNTPKTKTDSGLTGRRMREAVSKGYATPKGFADGGEAKYKSINSYESLYKAGGYVDDHGIAAGMRMVDVYYPTYTIKTGFLGLGKKEQRRRFKFGSSDNMHMSTKDFVTWKMGDVWGKVEPPETKPTETIKGDKIKPNIEPIQKRRRGSGAKDRGREGGNFSGDQQKNVRGEYAFKGKGGTEPQNQQLDPATRVVKMTLDKAGQVFNSVKDVGKRLLGFKSEENSNKRKTKENANMAVMQAVEAQNQKVAAMGAGGGEASQPEEVPIVIPNSNQWNEADPYFVSRFSRFRETQADLTYTPTLK